MNHRSPFLTLPAALLLAAAVATPALAGSDSDDENGGPVPTPAPIVQTPAPVPLVAPAPAPVATPPAVLAAPESPKSESKVRHTARKHAATHQRTTIHHAKRATHVLAVRKVALVTPRGGVQAGEGGTAAGLPLGLRVSLLLAK